MLLNRFCREINCQITFKNQFSRFHAFLTHFTSIKRKTFFWLINPISKRLKFLILQKDFPIDRVLNLSMTRNGNYCKEKMCPAATRKISFAHLFFSSLPFLLIVQPTSIRNEKKMFLITWMIRVWLKNKKVEIVGSIKLKK